MLPRNITIFYTAGKDFRFQETKEKCVETHGDASLLNLAVLIRISPWGRNPLQVVSVLTNSVFFPSLDDIFRPGQGFGIFFQVVEHMKDLTDVFEHPVFIYHD